MDFVGEILAWRGWDWVTLGSVVLGLAACAAFVITLQIRAGWDWWSNPFGRFLMTRKILLGCLFTLVLINGLAADSGQWRARPDTWPGQSMVTALLMLTFALQTFVPYRLLLLVQEEAHRKEGEKRS